MNKNILGALVIFAVTISILVLLNTLSASHDQKPKEPIAIEQNQDNEKEAKSKLAPTQLH